MIQFERQIALSAVTDFVRNDERSRWWKPGDEMLSVARGSSGHRVQEKGAGGRAGGVRAAAPGRSGVIRVCVFGCGRGAATCDFMALAEFPLRLASPVPPPDEDEDGQRRQQLTCGRLVDPAAIDPCSAGAPRATRRRTRRTCHAEIFNLT